jgi:hypothetical protein
LTPDDLITGERLAREVDRRRFLRWCADGAFGLATGVAVGSWFTGRASAHTLNGQAHCANISGSQACQPPNGHFCSLCNGHACPTGFHWTASYGYASACWCTISGPSGGYNICCDCQKHSYTSSADCGCFSFIKGGSPE